MVRINLVKSEELSNQHLRAEHVEILMLFSAAMIYDPSKVPSEYTLGKGHINFFKNKLSYLKRRFLLIQEEMRKRNMSVNAGLPSDVYSRSQWNDYTPERKDIEISRQRINEKLKKKPWFYTYYGGSLPKMF